MKLFLYEYANALGSIVETTLPDSILGEGGAMLSALAHDAAMIADCAPVTLVADRASRSPAFPKLPDLCEQVVVETPDQHDDAFRRLCESSDLAIIVAPEFDSLLFDLTQLAETAGARLACPDSLLVARAADKLLLNQTLRSQNIPATENWLASDAPDQLTLPCIVKPRFGAGSQDVQIVTSRSQLTKLTAAASDKLIVEAFAPGDAVSVAMLTGEAAPVCLPAMRQILSDDGKFHYLGGSGPLPDPLSRRAQNLATKAMNALANPRGYLGVDIVLGADIDGSEDRIVEINPRLTSSYLGLRQLCQGNLLAGWIRQVVGEDFDLHFRRDPISFTVNDVPPFAH